MNPLQPRTTAEVSLAIDSAIAALLPPSGATPAYFLAAVSAAAQCVFLTTPANASNVLVSDNTAAIHNSWAQLRHRRSYFSRAILLVAYRQKTSNQRVN